MSFSRRGFVQSFAGLAGASAVFNPLVNLQLHAQGNDARQHRIASHELITVRATERTVWMFVRLRTQSGLTGLGEASDAFGYANTTKADAARMQQTLDAFVALIRGSSPFDVARFREAGWAMATGGGLLTTAAFCAIEQAMWDLAGQALQLPSYMLWGGQLRDSLPVYANINRATRQRTTDGFAASARKAVAEGYRAIKAAPFDGYPREGSDTEIRQHVENGIACVMAIRDAVGDNVNVMIDCHSFFSVPASIELARRLQPANLTWFEEPLPPEQVEDTRRIKEGIQQPMAGGEILFAVEGFAELCRQRAVDVIMPDVKFCGGLLEMTHIAAMAYAHGVAVAPHNPSGPVCTMATVQTCAGMRNFRTLEMQWGEVPWRGEVLDPPEQFVNGSIAVPEAPGLGVGLRDDVAAKYAA
jgi:galactonate dehydratase